jgi:glycerol-3-phosphate acyltransferase PlsY
MVILLGSMALAFLIGAIPFGYVVGRWFFKVDLRATGSGNIGAANALRSMGKGAGAAVLILDALKGYAPVAVALAVCFSEQIDPAPAILIALAGVLGHVYSPFLGWRGGKGVATYLGTVFAFSWPAGLVAVCGWLTGWRATGFSSVGSLLLGAVSPFTLWWFTRYPAAAAYGLVGAALIAYTHRANIARLRAGTENRLAGTNTGA